jgi:hypothetical protein
MPALLTGFGPSPGGQSPGPLLHGLQYCPECLATGTPYFRKTWRLGFVVSCEKHGVSLRDACPHCGFPIVPHRLVGQNFEACENCRKALSAQPEAGATIPEPVVKLQRTLLKVLRGERKHLVGAWSTPEAFIALRTLLTVMHPRPVHLALRNFSGLDAFECLRMEPKRFEHARHADRLILLETLTNWISDWPASFRRGALAVGLTQRSFHRTAQPDQLTVEVSRLPCGKPRMHVYQPILQEKSLKRLRRHNPDAYRRTRAKLLIEAARHYEHRFRF